MRYAMLYAAAIAAANWLTANFGLVTVAGVTVTAGTYAAAAALVLRDAVQVRLGNRAVTAAILAGAVVSYGTSTPAIALASALAFAMSELVDFAVFTPLRDRNLPAAVIASSVVAAPVDTLLFLHLAGFGVTWQAVVGQFVVKTTLAGLVAWRLACSTSPAA